MHKNKQKRIISLILLFALCAAGVATILYNLNDNIVFFHPPSELDKIITRKDKVRLGGMIKEGSIVQIEEDLVRFTVTDFEADMVVEYRGALPALFRAKQGIVSEGGYDQQRGIFIATSLLAKHDENYMPPEIRKAIEKE